MKTNNKNVVRLTESKLKQIITESVKNVLNEVGLPKQNSFSQKLRSQKASDKQLAYIEDLLNSRYHNDTDGITPDINYMRNVYSEKKNKIDSALASEMIKYLKDCILLRVELYGDIDGYHGRGYSGSFQDLYSKGEEICSMLEQL